jgi:hypothetical protein
MHSIMKRWHNTSLGPGNFSTTSMQSTDIAACCEMLDDKSTLLVVTTRQVEWLHVAAWWRWQDITTCSHEQL